MKIPPFLFSDFFKKVLDSFVKGFYNKVIKWKEEERNLKNSNFHFVNLKRDFRNSEYDMEEEKELPPRGFFRTLTKNSFVAYIS